MAAPASPPALCRLLLLVAVVTSCALEGRAAVPVPAQQGEAESLQLEATYSGRSDASGLGELRLSLRDRLTQEPLDYPPRRLAAWLQKALPSLSEAEVSCVDKVRMLASSGIGRRAAIDFNVHRLLSVNEDRSVTFINPFLRLNQAKLEDVVTLPGDVSAVLHRPHAHEVWLALSEADTLVVIDTDERRIRFTHRFAPGSRPTALVETGGAVWVAMKEVDQWQRFDTGASSPSAVPAMRVESWMDVPGAATPIGLADGGLVMLVDGAARLLPVGGTVSSAVWSPLANRALVSVKSQGLLWLDIESGTVTQHLPLPDADQLAVFDDGRIALATGPDWVRIIDVAKGQIVQTLALESATTNIAFSAAFVYLHSAGSASATLLSLADVRRGSARPVRLALGSPVSDAATPPGVQGAQRLQPLPDGSGMYAASPLDAQIYQYAEGMMAPVGNFSNYRRSTLALLVLDDGLQSVGPGEYRAVVRAPAEGPYELVLSGVQPRFALCRSLQMPAAVGSGRQIRSGPGLKAQLVEAQRSETAGTVGTTRIEARLVDSATSEPVLDVPDLTLLAFDKRTGWQSRRHMRPTAAGTYEAAIEAPAAAILDLRVASQARELAYHAGTLGSYRVASEVPR